MLRAVFRSTYLTNVLPCSTCTMYFSRRMIVHYMNVYFSRRMIVRYMNVFFHDRFPSYTGIYISQVAQFAFARPKSLRGCTGPRPVQTPLCRAELSRIFKSAHLQQKSSIPCIVICIYCTTDLPQLDCLNLLVHQFPDTNILIPISRYQTSDTNLLIPSFC
jgi:hypothetical protein